MTRALVLGGGGVAGIAWETGMLLGLLDAGVDVLGGVDVVVGTSAGATVGAQVTSGVPLAELWEAHRSGSSASTEIAAEFDPQALMERLVALLAEHPPGEELRAAIGGYALSAATVPEARRRQVIEARLPVHDWPPVDLRVVAVDAASGATTVFTRSSGVALVDAVAASCAVPGVWPAVTIGDRRYVDGGVRTSTNVDLAAGYDVVLELAPFPDGMGPVPTDIARDVAELRERSRVLTVGMDERCTAATGLNPLDPATAAPVAAAARAQAAAHVDAVRELWA